MKKQIAVLLVICALLGVLLVPGFAQSGAGAISLRLNSNVAGCTEADAEQLIEILSGPAVYYYANSCPVSVADYAGGSHTGPLEAGRTYTVTYTLAAAEGSALPEALSEGDLALDCGKGVTVVYSKIIEMQNVDPHPAQGAASTTRLLRIIANVTVDSNVLQRMIGWLKDIVLKIRAWSLY